MDYKKAFSVARKLFFTGMAIIVIGGFTISYSRTVFAVLSISGLAVCLGAVILANFKYKCPHCSKGLDINRPMPMYCPHCGKRLY